MSAPVPRFFADYAPGDADLAGGFLADPEEIWQFNPTAHRLEGLRNVRCLVVLGEPGMGKTTAVCAGEHDLAPADTPVFLVDLASLDIVDLDRELRRLARLVDPPEPSGGEPRPLAFPLPAESLDVAADTAAVGTNGQQGLTEGAAIDGESDRTDDAGTSAGDLPVLCVVFDGVDEAARHHYRLYDKLVRWLTQRSADQLLVRFVCRSAEWPTDMAARLAVWAPTRVVHLLPLRACDAHQIAAVQLGERADAFLTAVVDRRVGVFAARPLTLNMLIGIFAEQGALPDRAVDLYEQGLLHLSALDRAAVSDEQQDTVAQRLAVAARAAAWLRLGGHTRIHASTTEAARLGDFTLDDLTGDTESCTGAPVTVTVRLLRRSLHTAVFTGEAEVFEPAHATFTDFLCARWLDSSGMSVRQIRTLLCAPGGLVFPQLRLVAGWMLGMDRARFGFLAAMDPESFLLDVDLPDDEIREVIVAGLLERAGRGLLREDLRGSFLPLNHPGLAAQLREAITGGNESARRFALRMAGTLPVPELVHHLLAVAHDEDVEARDRVTAANAAAHQDVTTSGLADLVDRSVFGPDVDAYVRSDMRGAALMASWPHALSTEQVLASLSSAGPSNYYGLERVFVSSMTSSLTADDLPALLAWLHRTFVADADTAETSLDGDGEIDPLNVDEGPSGLEELADAAFELAVASAHDPAVRDLLAPVIASRVARLADPVFSSSPPEVPAAAENVRRPLLLATLEHLNLDQVPYLTFGPWARFFSLFADLFILAAMTGLDPATTAKLTVLLPRLVTYDDSQVEAFTALDPDDPVLELLAPGLVLDLSEQWVEIERETRAKRAEQETRRQQEFDALLGEIRALVQRSAGGAEVFFELQRLLLATGRVEREFSDTFLATTRGFEALTTSEQALIRQAAQQYLSTALPHVHADDPAANLTYGDIAACRAFVLLASRVERPQGEDVLRRWTPVLIRYPAYSDEGTWDIKAELLDAARNAAPELVDTLLAAQLTLVVTTEDRVFLLERELDLCWSPALTETAKALFASATTHGRDVLSRLLSNNAPAVLAELLNQLLTQLSGNQPDGHEVNDGASARDATSATVDGDASSQMRQLIQLAYTHALAQLWPVFSRVMNDAPRLVASALEGIDSLRHQMTAGLDEEQVADLFRWAAAAFPPHEDPATPLGVYSPSGRMEAAGWRDNLIASLAAFGTRRAVELLVELAGEHPQLNWINHYLNVARHNAVAESFEPVSADVLRKLNADSSRWLLRDTEHLHALVVEALGDIQELLTGQTPDAHLLWDTRAKHPKSEDECSDYLRNRLHELLVQRRVVVNREVQVRRAKPSGIGERVDVLVQALVPANAADSEGRVVASVPIEVKWVSNSDLLTSMTDQLAERYQSPLGTAFGVYCVLDASADVHAPRLASSLGDESAPLGVARARLGEQQAALAASGIFVHVHWLDCARPRPVT